ncbi:hypothetical protein EDB86DRAFT_2833019 [Lactarius hatsudake]|nr:hypothetical protein EDB86DRAFT_2833019 [Lactarius hatsudake]
MPDTYLHELWTFHERFRTCVNTKVSEILALVLCWLDYIISTVIYPFLRDFVEFQKAWVQHVKGSTGCPYCGGISSEVVRAVWKDIDTIVCSSLEKAGSRHSRGRNAFSSSDQFSYDFITSRIHGLNLGYLFASIQRYMFSLAQPSNNEAVDGLPIVQLSDDAELVRALITALYPIPFEIPASYDRTLALLRVAAAQKYDMAARLQVSLGLSKILESSCDYSKALRALVKFRLENLTSCFKSFLDTSIGPSKIWRRLTHSPPKDKTRGGASTQSLPAWLHDVFREEIGGRYRALERPLGVPSGIRAKYMSALQKHVTTDKCTFCPGVHALRGEKYIAELERALTQTWNKTTLEFS